MKQKRYNLRQPGEKPSPAEVEALAKKKAEKEKAASKPGVLARPAVIISVLSGLGLVALGWLLSWWLYAPYAKGSISGVVTFGGTPLPGGRITFIPDQPGRPPASSMIDANGNYSIASCPAGPCRITVETFPPPPPAPEGPKDVKLPGKAPPAPVGVYVAIPPEYSSHEDSPLVYIVQPGRQTRAVNIPKP